MRPTAAIRSDLGWQDVLRGVQAEVHPYDRN
jgi:succinate dehydrogenase/fumarate reductase flavoprotein subunit